MVPYLALKYSQIFSKYSTSSTFAKITPCFQNKKSAILEKLPNGIGAGTTELKVLRIYGEKLFPLPPYNEQRRIVQRINELFSKL